MRMWCSERNPSLPNLASFAATRSAFSASIFSLADRSAFTAGLLLFGVFQCLRCFAANFDISYSSLAVAEVFASIVITSTCMIISFHCILNYACASSSALRSAGLSTCLSCSRVHSKRFEEHYRRTTPVRGQLRLPGGWQGQKLCRDACIQAQYSNEPRYLLIVASSRAS